MKKLISLVTAVCILPIMRGISANSAEKSTYEYTIINNQATIVGYVGEPVYINIPEVIEGCTVVEIRDNAFYQCGSLKAVTIPPTVTKIGHHAFYACFSLESAAIPDSVNEIGMGCFCGCSALTSASLPSELEALPESCFRSCTSLKSIVIPESVKEIGDFCFSGCTELKAVSLGDNTESIGDCSFYMCDAMTAMYIPPSVAEIGLCAVGFEPTENGASAKDGFTVIGRKKTAAEEYAGSSNLTFERADSPIQAFAVQKISGERVTVPSVFVIAGGLAVLIAGVLRIKQKRRHRRS